TEIRAAGHARQAVQAEYVAQGGAYAAVSYLDVLKAQGSLRQYLETNVAGDQALSPEDRALGYVSNALRIPMDDFAGFMGVYAPPLETEPARTPSLGPRNAYQPDFMVTGSDLYQIAREEAGRDLTGRGASYYRVSLTSRGTMAPEGDYRESADERERSYHEVTMRARAMTEVGPFWIRGH